VFCTVDERPDDLTLVRLVLARQRRQGASFEQAWRLSLSALDRPTKGKLDADALDATRHALEATRDAWLAAWRREDPPVPLHSRRATRERLRELQSLIAARGGSTPWVRPGADRS
jgi:hypothetical protein